jgi:hypothetical protein
MIDPFAKLLGATLYAQTDVALVTTSRLLSAQRGQRLD